MLITLGIYAIVAFTNALKYSLHEGNYAWALPLMAFLVFTVSFFVACILIFKNDSLACKITGSQDDAEDFDRKSYLIKSFRIAFVILGLLFLCSSNTISETIKALQAFSFSNIRMWISAVIETKKITGNLDFSKRSIINITALFKLAVIVYLLCGAPHIIRWHLKNSCLNPKTEDLTNE